MSEVDFNFYQMQYLNRQFAKELGRYFTSFLVRKTLSLIMHHFLIKTNILRISYLNQNHAHL